MKFSIVTITYNRAHLITETIQSVLNQTYTHFEHIIIDDGSTDETESIVKHFNDSRLRYYRYEKGGKRSFLRNEGIRKADGDCICILDSDDIWANNKLAVLQNIFNINSDINFIIHNIGFIPFDAVKQAAFTDYSFDFSKNILPDLLEEKILPLSIFTVKKETLDRIGLIDETLVDGQYDLYLRIASEYKVYYCTEKLAYIRKHDQNISKNRDMTHYDDYLKSIDKLKNNACISLKKHTDLKSRMYSKIAYIYHRQNEYQKAKENYLKSFQTRIFSYSGFKSFVMYLKINLMK
ncbi:glycosyltransferase family 2 protein [Flavobacterium sp.]|uniref:glycosyltransferase family 2 protein n=1 Tax=Flavobacterium sp. TaxID=239 RepID=UPI003D6A1B69